jgi:hypothetical protein
LLIKPLLSGKKLKLGTLKTSEARFLEIPVVKGKKKGYFNRHLSVSGCFLMEDQRLMVLTDWLSTQPLWSDGILMPLPGDASFRRYFRWQGANGQTAMAMDAPPPREDVRPFLKVRQAMSALGVSVPNCYARDEAQGFLLLEDFGDTTFAAAIEGVSDSRVDQYYRQALMQLAQWQSHENCDKQAANFPPYNIALLVREMQLLPDWLLAAHFDQPLSAFEQSQWQQWLRLLSDAALAQPKTLVHRDYHSRNLMVASDGRLGVIDFQDAVYGPLTYDAVSLLRDAYVQHDPEQVMEWLRFYFLQLVASNRLQRDEWQAFVRAFDWMGLQRHLKVLGIFARLYHRDGKNRYLANLPLVAHYSHQVASSYAELAGMANWLEKRVLRCLS